MHLVHITDRQMTHMHMFDFRKQLQALTEVLSLSWRR